MNAVVICIAVAASALQSWAISLMYGWYVEPLGAPPLNFAAIWGLMLLLAVIRGTKSLSPEELNWPLSHRLSLLFAWQVQVVLWLGIAAVLRAWAA